MEPNYIEFVLINSPDSVDIGQNKYLDLLSLCKGLQGTKYFMKESVRYFYDDLVYEVIGGTEVKTYRKAGINIKAYDTFIKMQFTKEKIPYFKFPSTTCINNVQYVSTAIIRFHNNIYMNFEAIQYGQEDSPITFKVFLNYNHDPSIDSTFIQSKMEEIERIINNSGIHKVEFKL